MFFHSLFLLVAIALGAFGDGGVTAATATGSLLATQKAARAVRGTTSTTLTASGECSESAVVSITDDTTQVTVLSFNASGPNYFAMYFQAGGAYTIQCLSSSSVSVSLYTGCGMSHDAVLALNRTGAVAFNVWEYSSVVVEAAASAGQRLSRPAFLVSPISADSRSDHTLANFTGVASFDSGSAARAEGISQRTVLHFDYSFALIAELSVSVYVDASSANTSAAAAALRSSSWASCAAYESIPGGFSLAMGWACLARAGPGLPEITVAVESALYPMLAEVLFVEVARTPVNSRCENATEFAFDTAAERKAVPFAEARDGAFWGSMAVAGEPDFVYVRAPCGNVSVYTDCDFGAPQNWSLLEGGGSFWAEGSACYKIFFDECPNDFDLIVGLVELSSSSSSPPSSSPSSSSVAPGHGSSAGHSSSDAKTRGSESSSAGRGLPSGSSGKGSGWGSSESGSENKGKGAASHVGMGIMISVIVIVLVVMIAAIVVAVVKKKKTNRLAKASRDLSMAFDDYNDDDEVNSLDNMNDGVRLLKLSEKEKSILFRSAGGDSDDDDDADDGYDDGSVPK